jgi:hypothetical protein
LRIYILGGGLGALLWFVATLALFAVVGPRFLPEGASFSDPAYDGRADGIVTRVEKTNTEIMNEPVMMVLATFTDDQGIRHEVRSYETTSSPPRLDSRVTVRYHSTDPDRGPVITGMRTHVIPWWLAPVFYVFAVGFALTPALVGLPRRRRELALVRHGAYVVGTIVDVRARGEGDGRECLATIELAVPDGDPVRIEARSAKDDYFTVGHFEGVVYDPAKPAKATLLRQLPGCPVIDDHDRVRLGAVRLDFADVLRF